MAHDIISDCLNQIMNAKRASKNELHVKRYSNFLLDILKIAKESKYLDYTIDEKNRILNIKILDLIECKTIKPRFNVKKADIERYSRRFLPARGFGIMLISTSKGLMTQEKALESGLGGSLVAYFY